MPSVSSTITAATPTITGHDEGLGAAGGARCALTGCGVGSGLSNAAGAAGRRAGLAGGAAESTAAGRRAGAPGVTGAATGLLAGLTPLRGTGFAAPLERTRLRDEAAGFAFSFGADLPVRLPLACFFSPAGDAGGPMPGGYRFGS